MRYLLPLDDAPAPASQTQQNATPPASLWPPLCPPIFARCCKTLVKGAPKHTASEQHYVPVKVTCASRKRKATLKSSWSPLTAYRAVQLLKA